MSAEEFMAAWSPDRTATGYVPSVGEHVFCYRPSDGETRCGFVDDNKMGLFLTSCHDGRRVLTAARWNVQPMAPLNSCHSRRADLTQPDDGGRAMSTRVLRDLPDSELCSAAYPALGADFGSLCNEADGHDGNHWALAVVAGAYRRYVVWTPAGEVLPDEETSHAVTAQGQTSPSKGDQVT